MSVNKVSLLGNVGKDPDVRYFETGKGVANFTLATTERARKWNDREIPERTEWHNIVVRGGLVQVVENYVHKGTKLYLEGKIQSRKYVDRENQTHFVTEIVADELEILSPRISNNNSKQYNNNNNSDDNHNYGDLGEPQNNDDDDHDLMASDFVTPF